MVLDTDTIEDLSSLKMYGKLSDGKLSLVNFNGQIYVVCNQIIFDKHDFICLIVLLDTIRELKGGWADHDIFKSCAANLKNRLINIWELAECEIIHSGISLKTLKNSGVENFYLSMTKMIINLEVDKEIYAYSGNDKNIALLIQLEHLETTI